MDIDTDKLGSKIYELLSYAKAGVSKYYPESLFPKHHRKIIEKINRTGKMLRRLLDSTNDDSEHIPISAK